MSNQNNGETHSKILTNACKNVCAFIKTITVDNVSKDEQMNRFETKINDLQCFVSELQAKLIKIEEQVKTLAGSLNFTIYQDESAIDLLTRWNSLFLKKNNSKKRKLYSPLKLSLNDISEVIISPENKSKSTKIENKNKKLSQNKLKHAWKLEIKRNGNPKDLLNNSKQTTLSLKHQEEKDKMDITTICNSTPKVTNLNLTNNVLTEVLNVESNNVSKNIQENNLTKENQMTDSCITSSNSDNSKEIILKSPNILNTQVLSLENNKALESIRKNNFINITQIDNDDTNISLNYFNNVNKPQKNVSRLVTTNISNSIESNTSYDVIDIQNQSCEEIIYSPIEKLKKETPLKIHRKKSIRNELNSFDNIHKFNDRQNNLPKYKFKEDPVRKHSERRLLDGWDCEDCCKYYDANNDNPEEAKRCKNKFSRHRSVKQQHHAPTPPDFWNPT